MALDRDTLNNYRAAGAHYLAEANDWALKNRQPGESLRNARARYAALKAPERQAALRAIASATAMPTMKEDRIALHDLVDDREEDGLWALDHSTRAFRVRPVRLADNWTGPLEGHLILINTQTIERLVVRADILGRPATDSDDFAASVFALRDWVNLASKGNA